MVRISLQRVILFIGFIVLAAMFFLVLTLSALSVSTTVSSPLPEGPYLVKDILFDEASSVPSTMISADDKVFFHAYDSQGRNLWVSDGTEAGTYQIIDFDPDTGAVPNSPTPTPYPTPYYEYDYPEAVNDRLYFSYDNSTHGKELWVSDGSISGTVMVKDIYTDTSSSGPYLLTSVNNQLLFTAYDGIGRDLWRSDGTVTNTTIVKDIAGIDYMGMVNMNGKAYFAGSDGVHGYELWSSDGTEEGTYMVSDIWPNAGSSGPHLYFVTDTHVFFFAGHPDFGGLWQSDGTTSGTMPVQDTMNGPSFTVLSPGYRATTDKAIFFTAYKDVYEVDLWTSDGTITGTHLVKDINPNNHDGVGRFQAVGSRMFFFANDGMHGSELWVSEGSEQSTYLVKDINAGKNHSLCTHNLSTANVNGYLFFTADDGEHGCELWMSNGTEEGTFMVEDIYPGDTSSSPQNFAVAKNTLFFSADDGTYGDELWSLGNMAPVAKDDTAVSTMNNPINIPVVENDFDVNLDAFTISAVTQPSSGVVTIDGDSVVYTPDDAFIGSDTFTYTVQEDGGGLTAVAQVNITVTGYRTYLPTIMHLVENP